MTIAEQLYEECRQLPESLAREALNFVRRLRTQRERAQWSEAGLVASHAGGGMRFAFPPYAGSLQAVVTLLVSHDHAAEDSALP